MRLGIMTTDPLSAHGLVRGGSCEPSHDLCESMLPRALRRRELLVQRGVLPITCRVDDRCD